MTDQPRPFRFLHCADLHLDSPFEGLGSVDDQIAPALCSATFRAFDNVIGLAIREQVDLILIAGDVFDGPGRSLQAQLRFRDALARAAAAGTRYCVVHGDQDPLCDWQIDLAIAPGSCRFDGETVRRATIERDGQPIVDVYGWSHASRDGKDDPATQFRRDGPSPVAIGLLHCRVDEPAAEDHLVSCTLDDLADSGMDYLALGHVHEHRVLRTATPTVAYAGSVQARNFGQPGPHGCLMVQVDESGQFDLQFVATDTIRFFERQIDIASIDDLDGLRGALNDMRERVRAEAEGRAAIVRLHLGGNGRLHSLLRRAAIVADLTAFLRDGEPQRRDFVWVESLRISTRPELDLGRQRETEDLAGDYLRELQKLRESDDAARSIRRVLTQRPEYNQISGAIDALPDHELLSLLDEAEGMGWDLLSPAAK